MQSRPRTGLPAPASRSGIHEELGVPVLPLRPKHKLAKSWEPWAEWEKSREGTQFPQSLSPIVFPGKRKTSQYPGRISLAPECLGSTMCLSEALKQSGCMQQRLHTALVKMQLVDPGGQSSLQPVSPVRCLQGCSLVNFGYGSPSSVTLAQLSAQRSKLM